MTNVNSGRGGPGFGSANDTDGPVTGLFAAFLDRMGESVTFYDADGVLRYCNARARERFPGIIDKLVPGTHIQDLLETAWDCAPSGRKPGTDKAQWVAEQIDLHWSVMPSRSTYVDGGEGGRVTRHRMEGGGILVVHSDETPLKIAERHAEDVAYRLTELVNSIDDGVAVFDRDGRLVMMNEGMPGSFDPLLDVAVPGSHYVDINRAIVERGVVRVDDGEEEEWLAARLRAIENRQTDFERHAATGNWYSVSRFPTRDGGFIAVRRDITAQVEAEHRAEVAMRRLEDFIEGMSDGVALYDADDRLVLCNEALKRQSNPVADLLVPGTHISDIVRGLAERRVAPVPQSQREAWIAKRLNEVADRAPSRHQYWSTGLWIEVERYPTRDGGYLAIRRDVTQLRQAEAEAQTMERTLGAVIDAVADRVTVMKPDGRVIAANRASLDHFGSGGRPVIGESIVALLPPDRRVISDCAMVRLHETMAPVEAEEFHDGRWQDIRMTPITDETGHLMSVVAIGRDITEAKQAAVALAKAKRQAERASRFKSEFLANMSHEFRTPLNAIMGFSEALLEGIAGPIADARQREYLVSIQNSSEHLARLIDDLLDISVIEAGRLTLVETTFPPALPVERAIAMAAVKAKAAGVSVVMAAMEDSIWIEADRRRMEQILTNLVNNAVKYAPGGRVTVSGRTAVNGAFAYAVSDDGPGMTGPEINEAVSRFGRVGDTSVEGTGLGLPLCKALAEAHGGDLEIRSSPGQGTTVIVRLPASRVHRSS